MAGGRVGISRYYSLKQHACSGSEPESSLATFTTRNDKASDRCGAGSTHAWAEVFVPGAGWITFDPTNRSLGGFNLIPVAVARDIRQTIPVSGSFVGSTGAFAGMSVEVLVTS